jgi:hypothetical protein
MAFGLGLCAMAGGAMAADTSTMIANVGAVDIKT